MVNEVACLRMELQQVRDDRDRHQLQVQTLTAEYTKYKESMEKSCFDLDNLTSKKDELEVVYIILSFFLCRFCFYFLLTYYNAGYSSGKMSVTK